MTAVPGPRTVSTAPLRTVSTAPLRTVSTAPLRTVSLRRRVTGWVLVLLLVTLTVMGLVVNWLLGDALRSDLQQRLEDRAGFAAVLQEQGVTGQTLADRLAGNGVFSSFVSGNQQFIGRDDGPPAVPPGANRAARPPKPVPRARPTTTFSESDGRLTARVDLPSGVLTLSTSETDIGNTLARLRQIELVVGGAAVLLTGLMLTVVVRAALRPLQRMTELARRIRDGSRGRRLRPTRPTTDLGRTAVALDDMLDALESAERQAQLAEEQMRQFLGDASHDLRTPLAGVIAGAEQLLRTPSTRAEREDLLVQVVRQARRAARLVDDLLLMTRLDAGTGRGERVHPGTSAPQHPGAPAPAHRTRQLVDPAVLLDREIRSLQLRRPDLRTDVDGPSALVLADPDQLQRALGNLLENAAAVTPPAGTITVTSRVTVDMLTLRVIDRGPGVAGEDQERIFHRFVRLSSSRSGPGTGLGLPICRAVVQADGGTVTCLPWTGGACFEVTLPRAPLTAASLSHSPLSATAAAAVDLAPRLAQVTP